MRDECALCELKKLTSWHYNDAVIVICDCVTCAIPMLVFRRHGDISEKEKAHARQTIKELYGWRIVNIRTLGRQNLTHDHWHLYLREKSDADKTG